MVSLPRPDSIVLQHEYYRGTVNDFSSRALDGTLNAGATLIKSGKYKSIHFDGVGSYILIADDAFSLDTEGTWSCWLKIGTGGKIQYAFGAGNTASLNNYFKFGLDASNQIQITQRTSAANRVIVSGSTVLEVGKWYNLVYTVNSAGNALYVNGNTETGNYTTGSSSTSYWFAQLPAIDRNRIGSAYANTVEISFFDGEIRETMFWDVALSADEVVALYNYGVDHRSIKLQKKIFSYPSTITGKENGLVAAWDMENVHGEVIDKTGNGYNGTIIGATQKKGIQGIKSLSLNGTTDYVEGADLAAVSFPYTISAVVKRGATGASHPIFVTDDSTNYAGFALMFVNTDTISIRTGDNTGISSPDRKNFNTTATYGANKWYHIVAVFTSISDFKIYVNGVEQAGSFSGTATTVVSTADNSRIGYSNLAGGFYFNGEIAEVRAYDRALSATEVEILYNKIAKLPNFIDNLEDANESIATEGGTTGAFLSNTKWRFGDTSARYKISSDTVLGKPRTKVIECTTAGILYQESQQAYGTWEFDFYKEGDVDDPYIQFMGDVIGIETATGQDGYSIWSDVNERLYLRESVNGVGSSKFYTAVDYFTIQTWYKLRITRRYDGQFTVYIKGGTFSPISFDDWTIIVADTGTNPIVDNTMTTSKYFSLNLGAGSKIANIKFSEGVLAP